MSHFAEIDENNKVIRVLVVEKEFVDTGILGNPNNWIQTSYNTYGGIHSLGGQPLRKNYAGIGYTYDIEKDAFIPPKPYESWLLNEDTCLWKSPIKYPDDNKLYIWNENIKNWELVDIEN